MISPTPLTQPPPIFHQTLQILHSSELLDQKSSYSVELKLSFSKKPIIVSICMFSVQQAQITLTSSHVTDVSITKENFHTLVSNILSHSAYLYSTVIVYYILLLWAHTTTLQHSTNQGPTQPHGVLSQIFFGVNNLLWSYKLFCYWTFVLRATAQEQLP